MTKLGSVNYPFPFQDAATGHELNTGNSGVGLTQLPPGHTRLSSPQATLVAVGAAMINGVSGQFQKSTDIQSNWLNDKRFGKK